MDFIILEPFFDGPLKDMRGMALLLPFFEDQDRSCNADLPRADSWSADFPRMDSCMLCFMSSCSRYVSGSSCSLMSGSNWGAANIFFIYFHFHHRVSDTLTASASPYSRSSFASNLASSSSLTSYGSPRSWMMRFTCVFRAPQCLISNFTTRLRLIHLSTLHATYRVKQPITRLNTNCR